jgi:glycosyltransferase involved in cell wall biosynthesis
LLNVLLITQYFPPDLGGAATRNSNISKGLLLNGCNLTIITGFPHYPNGFIPPEYKSTIVKVETINKIKIIRTFMPQIKSEGIAKRMVLMVSFAISSMFALPFSRKVDIIWGGSWLPGILYSKLKRIPVVLDVCDLTVEDLPLLKIAKQDSLLLKIASSIYRFFYAKGDAVAPISPGYVKTIVNKYSVKRDRISIIPVGVDSSEFKDNKKIRLQNDPFKIIYAGVLGVGYDFEQVFGAAKILKVGGIDVQFILHGGGECVGLIKSRLKELNLTNVILSDRLLSSRKEVACLLKEADALILPLKDYGAPYPGIPSKLYEYQSVGRPIICCAKGEPAKYIRDSNSGVIVSPENPRELARAIKYLSANIEIAQQMGENGRRFVEREVDIAVIGAKAKALFTKLMAKNAAS